ncbi:MAG: gamma-glutamyl-gamma-aminobutyrate hydrolase family protein [Rikenellaceae bacterium]|nr:gamma-glutamyl-gamma-aminobutyrate hydrolase family protein [Rikenellaceae bacterium]
MPGFFTDFNTAADGAPVRSGRQGAPVVGLSVNVDGQTSCLHAAYVQSVLDAGGIPLLIPATTDADALREMADRMDGLILTGGSDVDGRYFGEATLAGVTDVDALRDAYDFLLLRLAVDRQVPVFGICRGMQVIHIAFGGRFFQDIPSQLPGVPLNHAVWGEGIPKERPAHTVRLAEGSVLASIFGRSEIEVNSRHHQAVKGEAPGFRTTAVAPDGVIEAIEGFPERRIFGVQWHPENMAAPATRVSVPGPAADPDPGTQALFRFFIHEASLFRRAKAIHEKYLTVDSHTDTPMLFDRYAVVDTAPTLKLTPDPMDIGRRDPVARVDLVKMAEGHLDAAIEAAYIPQGPRNEVANREVTARAVEILKILREMIDAHSGLVGQARTFAEAEVLKRAGKKSIFFGLENGYALGRNLENLTMFRELGVVYVTLCHNGANDLCDSSAGAVEHGGLSSLGREAVREMNRLGVVIDLSHAADTTFWDVLNESTAPVIASHSSARALCDHPRNLTDDQLRAIAAKGGVVQVCLYHGFLSKDHQATLMDAVDHIDHVVRVAGVDCAGIGSDFDGGGGIPGCDGANELINITIELLRRGYTEPDIEKILGRNLRRVIDNIQAAATH